MFFSWFNSERACFKISRAVSGSLYRTSISIACSFKLGNASWNLLFYFLDDFLVEIEIIGCKSYSNEAGRHTGATEANGLFLPSLPVALLYDNYDEFVCPCLVRVPLVWTASLFSFFTSGRDSDLSSTSTTKLAVSCLTLEAAIYRNTFESIAEIFFSTGVIP